MEFCYLELRLKNSNNNCIICFNANCASNFETVLIPCFLLEKENFSFITNYN